MMCWCAVKKLRTHAELIEWFLKLRTFFRFFFKTQNTRLLSCCTRFVEHRGRETSADSAPTDKAHTDTQRSALTGVRTIACRDVDWNDCSTQHPPPPLPRTEYDDQQDASCTSVDVQKDDSHTGRGVAGQGLHLRR